MPVFIANTILAICMETSEVPSEKQQGVGEGVYVWLSKSQ